MINLIGITVLVLGLICWLGQTLSLLAPDIASKLGLCEQENEIDPSLYIIETKALGITDMLLCWTLPVSALLMILNHPFWPVLALIGGGIYLYLSGFIVLGRFFLKRMGKKIGPPSTIIIVYSFSGLWILSALTMIILAIKESMP